MGELVRDTKQAKKTYSVIAAAIAVTWLLGFMFQIVWEYLESRIESEAFLPYSTWLSLLVPLYLMAFPVGLMLLKNVREHVPYRKRLPVGKAIQAFCIAVFLMYIGACMGDFLTSLFSSGEEGVVVRDIAGVREVPWLKFVAIVLITPFMEELLFRKVVIDRVLVFGRRGAIVFSALTFGLFHMNIPQFFYAAAAGLVLAYVYTETGSMRAPFLLHMALNFLLGFLPSYLTVSFREAHPYTVTAFEAGMATLAALGFIFLCLFTKQTITVRKGKVLQKDKCMRHVLVNPGFAVLSCVFCGISVITHLL